jgi:hypothetical protein
MEKQKLALVESLSRKGCILSELFVIQSLCSAETDAVIDENSLPTPTVQDIDSVMKDILKFTDYTDSKVRPLSII